MKRLIANAKAPALIAQAEGVIVRVIGATEHAELNISDTGWRKLHTKPFSFAKVKADHGVTEDPTS